MAISQAQLRRMYDQAARGMDVAGILPSTFGSAQANAVANRAANAGSSRRALKPSTVKAIGDLVRDAAPIIKGFTLAKNMKDASDILKGTDQENEEFTATVEQVYAKALQCMKTLAARLSGLSQYAQKEQADSEHEAAGATGATGEIAPANAKAGALDGLPVMDAASIARIEAARKLAQAAVVARNPARVAAGLPDDVLTDISQLQFCGVRQ